MARFTGKIRRLADMRSISGRCSNGTKFPHEIYMRLCCLEMERFRREQEQSAAAARARKCVERCHTIEVEVQVLLRSIGQVPVPGAVTESDDAQPEAAAQSASKLLFTY
jgi:hypothetical protein